MNCPPSQRFAQWLLFNATFLLLLCVQGRGAADDNWDPTLGTPGPDGPIWSVTVRDRDVYVGGTFEQVGGVQAANIAKWNGSNWIALGSGLTGGVLPEIHSLLFIGSELYAGGFFTSAGGASANNVAKWDGTNWSALGSGLSGGVRALAVDNGNLYAGGSYSSAGGVAAANIARWDGTNWHSLSTGVTWSYPGAAVDSLVARDGTLWVGGRFRSAGSIAATNIAKWDGAQWSPLGHGLRYYNGAGSENGVVRALALIGNSLYAGGGFSLAGTANATGIARWDGTNWLPLAGGVNHAWALATSSSDLYVGGFFDSAGAVPAKNIAKWTGTIWESLGSGTSTPGGAGSVRALAVNGSELLVGGFFTQVAGKPSDFVATWHIPHALFVSCAENIVTLSWPASGTNFVLEAKASVADTNWSVVATTPALVGDELRVTNHINSPSRFFHLRRK